MGKIIAWVVGIFVVLIVIGKCSAPDDVYDPEVENAKIRAEFDSPKLPPTDDGEPVSVPSDPGATYRLLSHSKLPNGNLQAVTRRDGSSGTSFARREIDCDAMTFRYLGEGDTLEQAMQDGPNPGDMGELTEQSISTYVSVFACGKAGA